MTFASHLSELRSRLLQSVVWLILASSIGYYFRHQLEYILLRPIGQPLFYSSPSGALEITLNISLAMGMIITFPILTYHLTKFIEPTLPPRARRSILWLVFLSCLLVGLGLAFAYFVTIPRALHFLGLFKTDQIKPLITTDKYLSFIAFYLIGSAIAFQLPIVVGVANLFVSFTVKQLMSYQRYVIVLSFIIAAVITLPNPDPFNQTLVALVLIALYQVSILGIWLINRKRPTKKRPKLT